MVMIETEINPVQRRRSRNKLGSELPGLENTFKTTCSVYSQLEKTKGGKKQDPAPIMQTCIPLKFQQLITSIRANDEDARPPLPVRRISRSRSCLSSRSLRASIEELQGPAKPKRRVSFGNVEGLAVENLSLKNKSALWFSRDEYTTMRQEAFEIVKAKRKNGTLKESSRITSRGLEKIIHADATAPQIARICVLEHHDLAMYALASRRAVHKAQQLAEHDALEACLIQKENGLNRRQQFRSSKKESTTNRLPGQRSGSTLMARP